MTWRLTLLSGMLLGAAGCATPGSLHVYTIAADTHGIVRDHGKGNSGVAEMRTFLEPGEKLTVFAYDPYTDHFFLRLAPGNRIRVVDRPARAVKREFTIASAPWDGGGDMAARPEDGHLFLVHPATPALLETTRLGRLLRTIPLEGLTHPAAGIAIDPSPGRLLVLHADGRRVTFHEFDGRRISTVVLEKAVSDSLAFDPNRREFHAPLREGGGNIGVFDDAGRLLRTIGTPAGFVDVGPRSFIRIF